MGIMLRLTVFGLLCFIATFLQGADGEEAPSAVAPLIKLFQSGRLPAERQATVVEMICQRGNDRDLRLVFDRILNPQAFDRGLRTKAMVWLADAAATRKVKPVGDLSGLSSLIMGEDTANDEPMRAAAIRAASTWRDGSIGPALKQIAGEKNVSPGLQKASIDGLAAIADTSSQEALKELAVSGHSISVRAQATAGLVGLDLPFAAQAAAEILAGAAATDDCSGLIDAFLNRQTGPEALGGALAGRPIAVDVAKRALRYMYSVGRSDAALSDVLGTHAGIDTNSQPPTPDEVAQVVADVIAKGDPVRGEAIFRRKDLSCMKCHSVNRAGGQVGPELSAVGGSSPVDYVVNSILNPNLAVKEQFVTRVFILESGKNLTGVVVDRDEVRVNVRDANGRLNTIPTADIEEELEGKSLMPQGLTKFLTRDELLDLARFVSELGKPGRFAVQQAKTIQRWRVLQNPSQELTGEVPHLEHIRQLTLGTPPEAWEPAYARVSGILPLAEGDLKPVPRVLIMQAEFDVAETGTVELRIDCTEPYQVWIDSQVQEPVNKTTITPDVGRHTFTMRIEVSDQSDPGVKVEFVVPTDSRANLVVVGGP